MQLTNSPSEGLIPKVEAALQPQRLARYLPAAEQDKSLALRYYLWNCAISESFYIPLHFGEIICRNAIHNALLFKLGETWFDNATLHKIMDERFSREVAGAVSDERSQHGQNMTAHHVASALTFGFWEHLTTKRFERLLWNRGIRHNFPGAKPTATRQSLHDLIESVRRWRNRIAHHRAIFDKDPTRKYQDTVELMKWACDDTANWVTTMSRVPQTINMRPKAV